jgi:gamma-glutamyltranspeptidase/glutathione hydrolase
MIRTRPEVMSEKAIVSTSSIQASLTGNKILNDGGNVVDAAIATSAVLAVTQNNLCGLGGDGFALLRIKGEVVSLNSSGKSSKNVNADIYKKLGMDMIPHSGPLAAITVPGLVGLLKELYENYASKDIQELLAPAIKFAHEGFAITHNYSRSLHLTLRGTKDEQFHETFSKDGYAPGVGDIFRQKDLANVFKALSENGFDDFYQGNLADKLEKSFKKSGILIDSDDLHEHKVLKQKPVASEYEGRTVYELPPNSQGATVNFWLNSIKFMDDEKLEPDELLLKSGLIANKFRRRYIGDPEIMNLPDNFLTESFYRKLLEEENLGMNSKGKDGDTTYFTIANTEGDAISMIQSNYTGFGSAVVPEGTGISMQNRGSYFSLDPTSHNYLEPRKRTFHTLCACIIEREKNFEFSLGTMGGDIQPQIHVNMIYNLINRGLGPQESIDLPRMNFPASIYETPDLLLFENGREIKEYMFKMFRRIKETSYLNSAHGHCQIIKQGENGVLQGGADPRGDGFAIPLY